MSFSFFWDFDAFLFYDYFYSLLGDEDFLGEIRFLVGDGTAFLSLTLFCVVYIVNLAEVG